MLRHFLGKQSWIKHKNSRNQAKIGVSVKCSRGNILQFSRVISKIWPAESFLFISSPETSLKIPNFLRSQGFSRAASRGATRALQL